MTPEFIGAMIHDPESPYCYFKSPHRPTSSHPGRPPIRPIPEYMEESDPFLQHDPWHIVNRPSCLQPPPENNENEPGEEQPSWEDGQPVCQPVDSSSSTEQASDPERVDRSRLQELLAAQSSSSFPNASQQGFRSAETRERLLREQVANTAAGTVSLGTPPRGPGAVLPSWMTSGYLRQHMNPQGADPMFTYTREEPEEEQPRPQSTSSSGDFDDNPQ